MGTTPILASISPLSVGYAFSLKKLIKILLFALLEMEVLRKVFF